MPSVYLPFDNSSCVFHAWNGGSSVEDPGVGFNVTAMLAGVIAAVAPSLALDLITAVSDAVEDYFSPHRSTTPELTTSANLMMMPLERIKKSDKEEHLTLAEQMNCIVRGLVPAEEIWDKEFSELRALFIEIANPRKGVTADHFSKIYLRGSLPLDFQLNESVIRVIADIKKHTGVDISFDKPPLSQWKEDAVTINVKRNIQWREDYDGPIATAEQNNWDLRNPLITLFIDSSPSDTIFVLLHELMHFFLSFANLKVDKSHTNEIIFSRKILELTQQMDPDLPVFSVGGGSAFGYGKNIYQVNELFSLLGAFLAKNVPLENGLPPIEKVLLEIAFKPEHNISNSSLGNLSKICALLGSSTTTTTTITKTTKTGTSTTTTPTNPPKDPLTGSHIVGIVLGIFCFGSVASVCYLSHNPPQNNEMQNTRNTHRRTVHNPMFGDIVEFAAAI